MSILARFAERHIMERLFQKKIIILYGARQVGKTTLVNQILAKYEGAAKYLSCELAPVQLGLNEPDIEKIRAFLGDYRLIVLDEAQKIPNIGKILKVIVDFLPDIQIIATGSSSFDLASSTAEPLTGRTFTTTLSPFSYGEIAAGTDLFTAESKIESMLRFGSYPEVFFLSEERAIERLNELAGNYLYKDILQFEGLRKTSLVKSLLEALALQIGNEVSYQELAAMLGVSRLTVQKYLDILEQSFIIFRLRAFSRNLRKEISKSFKVYFVDLGIRNSLIQNFNPLSLRTDAGALWENYCVMERQKFLAGRGQFVNTYFWRTYDQREVDYVEESGGRIRGYEFKFGERDFRHPQEFEKTYDCRVELINKENFRKFVS